MRLNEIETDVQALLLKLRKGSAAGLTFKKLSLVFTALPGWKIEKILAYLPTDDTRSFFNNRPEGILITAKPTGLLIYSYDANILKQYRDQLVNLIPTSEPVADKKSPEYYIEEIGDIETVNIAAHDTEGFFITLRVKVKADKITSPDNKEFVVCENFSLGLYKRITYEHWYKWAKDNTTLIQDVLNVLGMEAHINKADIPRQAKENQTLGTCAICGNRQVVRHNTMVLHGYERPGVGYIQGTCFGTNRKPYELSAEACVEYKQLLNSMIVNKNKILARYKNNEITEINVPAKVNGVKTIKRITPDSLEWVRAYTNTVHTIENEILSLTADIKYMDKLINDWVEKPLIVSKI